VSERALTLSVELTAAAFFIAFLALAEWNRIAEWLRRRR
jgi:hypothetical protein